MPQVKKFVKDDIINSIEQLVKLHYRTFIINRNNKTIVIEYSKLKNMTLASIISMIDNSELYIAKVTIEDAVFKTRERAKPKAKADIGTCKVNLKDIYNDVKDKS